MSTSAVIYFMSEYEYMKMKLRYDNELLVDTANGVYIHSDGYPEAVTTLLKSYLSLNGAKSRANDISYLTSFFITYTVMNKFKDLHNKDLTLNEMESLSDFNGVGVINGNGGDYQYVVTYCNGNFIIETYHEYDLIDSLTL